MQPATVAKTQDGASPWQNAKGDGPLFRHGTKRSTLNLLHPGRLGAAADVRKRLLSRVLDQAPQSRSLRRRQGSVLEAVRLVLEGRAEPMRVRDIHAEVERAFRAAVPFRR